MQKAKRGRPTRAATAARRKAALAAAGIDPASVDPRAVLAQVAGDVSAPASARVTAAKALIEDELQRDIRKRNAAAW
jgi:hypothetical protein